MKKSFRIIDVLFSLQYFKYKVIFSVKTLSEQEFKILKTTSSKCENKAFYWI